MFKTNPKEKFRLFKQSKNFCAVPWGLLFIKEDGEVKVCVKNSTLTGNLCSENIEEIINNPVYSELKEQFLDDIPPKSCNSCFRLENNGDGKTKYGHIRAEYNKLLAPNDVDYYNSNEFVLGALDLHWSSTCNLKCVTCYAGQSSSIAVEQGLKPRHTPTESAHKLIDWIEHNQSTLREVYLSGGEPTLIKYNLKLLQRLEKRNDLLIRVNSNMMWDQDHPIVQEILKFPNVMFTCSVDGTHERFDYIRRGANWNKCLSNIKFLQTQPNVNVRINSVFCILTAKTLVDTIDYLHSMEISNFTINQCGMGQTHLRARNMPNKTKELVKQEILRGLKKYSNDLNLVGQLNNCLNELEQCKDEEYDDYLNNIDQLANTNWKELFGELL